MTKSAPHHSLRFRRKPLCWAIATGLVTGWLFAPTAFAQTEEDCEEMEGTPPGLYATTDEGTTFLIQGDKVIDLPAGKSGYAGEGKLTCIRKPPEFLDWPCSTDAANARKFRTYALGDISAGNVPQEVVRRYFEVPEVIEPIPNFIDGEYHAAFELEELMQFASPAYWYHPNPDVPFMQEKRPKTLLIALFVGTNQVILDNHAIDDLSELYAGQKIPVVFLFNDSNEVPISYFGDNVSLEEVLRAFNERGIKVADVPMWPLGDFTLAPTAGEFQQFFDLPAVDDIDPIRREALAAGLETYGFTRKPIFVTLLAGNDRLYVDDPERVAVALSLGIERIPTVLNFVEPDSHLRRCGPGTPVGSSGVSGSTTPPGGPLVPPGAPSPPPPPEPNASDS